MGKTKNVVRRVTPSQVGKLCPSQLSTDYYKKIKKQYGTVSFILQMFCDLTHWETRRIGSWRTLTNLKGK